MRRLVYFLFRRGAYGSSDQRDLRTEAGVQVNTGLHVSDAFQAMVEFILT
jgi:hypothetical protein